jgi:hypothetical protein
MDVIELLQQQHDEIRERFDRVETADARRRAYELELLTDAIALHLELHERHLSPVLRALCLEAERREAAAERHTICRMLDELATGTHGPPAPPLIELLRATIVGHCEREEQRLVVAIAERLSPSARQVLAQSMLETMAEIENENWVGASHVSAW